MAPPGTRAQETLQAKVTDNDHKVLDARQPLTKFQQRIPKKFLGKDRIMHGITNYTGLSNFSRPDTVTKIKTCHLW